MTTAPNEPLSDPGLVPDGAPDVDPVAPGQDPDEEPDPAPDVGRGRS